MLWAQESGKISNLNNHVQCAGLQSAGFFDSDSVMSLHSDYLVTCNSITVINAYLIPFSQQPHNLTPVSCFALWVSSSIQDHLGDRLLLQPITLRTSYTTKSVNNKPVRVQVKNVQRSAICSDKKIYLKAWTKWMEHFTSQSIVTSVS